MPKRFKFCIHCRKTITESEIGRGEFVKTRYGMLCLTCAERLEEEPAPAPAPTPAVPAVVEAAPAPAPEPEPEPPPPPPPPAPAPEPPVERAAVIEAPPAPESRRVLAELERLNQQVEQVQRSLLFEKSSSWTVLAAVAQSVAAGLLVIALLNWLDNPGNLLLAALAMQTMALTFFVKAR